MFVCPPQEKMDICTHQTFFRRSLPFFYRPLIHHHSFPREWKGTKFCLKVLRASRKGSTVSICRCQFLTSTLAISWSITGCRRKEGRNWDFDNGAEQTDAKNFKEVMDFHCDSLWVSLPLSLSAPLFRSESAHFLQA